MPGETAGAINWRNREFLIPTTCFRTGVSNLGESRRRTGSYLGFRGELEGFQKEFFSGLCTRKCFSSRASACCNRDGIAVFFAKETVLERNPLLKGRWEDLRSRERQYTWPDRPILFDELEWMFLRAGHESPLMYFHRSPGLRRVRARTKLRS